MDAVGPFAGAFTAGAAGGGEGAADLEAFAAAASAAAFFALLNFSYAVLSRAACGFSGSSAMRGGTMDSSRLRSPPKSFSNELKKTAASALPER